MQAYAMTFVLVALVPMCGILMALTPSLMPRSECFAVTIPEAAQADTRIVQMKRSYRKAILGITAVVTVVAAWLVPGAVKTDDFLTFAIVYTAAVMIPLAAGFLLMLKYRGRTMRIKEMEGWAAQLQASATVVGADTSPQPLGMGWNLLYLPVFVLTGAIIYVLYPMMPEQIPMHMSLNGEVTGSVAKSPLTVSFPLFLNLFLAAIMVFSNWAIGRSKRVVDPKKPSSSAYAYGAFAKAQSVLLIVMGLALTTAFGVFVPLSFAGVMSMATVGLLIAAITVIIVVAAFAISLRYGQSGARVFEGTEAGAEMSRDEDAHWKLGVFYVNSADTAIFVPKRFGFGWTLNLGRVGTWLILVALIAFIAGFAVLVVTAFA